MTLILSVQYANASERNPIEQTTLSDGTTLLKIHFNYMDASNKKIKIKNTEGVFNVNFPLPTKWEIIDAKGFIQYSPSLLLLKDISSATLSFNDVFLKKYKLFDHTQDGVGFTLDPDLFMANNSVTLNIIQHYTKECENTIHSSLWTDIELSNSYIELHVRPKAIKEELASIKKELFDHTQYRMAPINFVMDKTDDETLKHFALFSAMISTNLKSRLTKTKVSNKIDPNTHNIIINTKEKAKEYLSLFKDKNSSHQQTSLSFEEKLTHDINIIQNPYRMNKAIIVIAPKDPAKIKESIYTLSKSDLNQSKDQGIDAKDVQIPLPSKAYSAKNFVPVDKKISFKELGFKTTLLKGWYPPKVKVKFKVYPDHYFNSKNMIDTHIHYLFPSLIHEDSIVNISMNNIFVDQVNIVKSAKESNIKMSANKLFNFDRREEIPSLLLNKGSNELKLDFSLVALRNGECDLYATENLVASVLDDSYFILPKSKRWIELPYMQLITNAQYPYSIYPDLQDTVIYLANKNPYTIASAMDFIFFMTQEIGSFPHYMRITTKLTPQDQQKNLVVFGSIHDENLHRLSKNAPIEMNQENMKGSFPSIYNLIAHENLLNRKILEKYKFLTSMKEINLPDHSIIIQMFRSSFNTDKSILFFAANDPSSLHKGVSSILQFKNRDTIQGDLVIYDYDGEEGVSFNVKDKYILSQLNWLETLSLKIGYNPLIYMMVFFFILLIMVSVIRLYLKKFQEEHHPDA